MSKATIDISKARKQLNSLDKRLSKEPIIWVTRHNKDAFVVVDADCMSAMLETLEIMADPVSYRIFMESLEDIRAGRLHDHEQLRKGSKDAD